MVKTLFALTETDFRSMKHRFCKSKEKLGLQTPFPFLKVSLQLANGPKWIEFKMD